MSKVNIKKLYDDAKLEADYGIVSEAQLNEFSFKDLKDKAKSLAGKAKDALGKAKDKVIDKAKEIKKTVDDKGGLKKIANDTAVKAGNAMSKAADKVNAKAAEIKKDIKDKGVKAVAKDAVDKVKSKFAKEPKKFDDSKKYTKEDIVSKVQKMSDANKVEAVKFIAKQMKVEPIKLITSNISDIASSVFNEMKDDVGEFKDDVKDIGKKNKEDVNKDKEIKTDDIDERKSTFSCVFDGEDGKKILEVAKKIDEKLKQAPKVADEMVKKTEEDLKKAGVKDISKEEIEKNATAIIGTIENNDKLKGEDLKDKIDTNVEKVSEKLNKEEKTDEAEVVTEAHLGAKIFNTFAGLLGKNVGEKATDTEHYTNIVGHIITNINGDGTGSYSFNHFTQYDKEKSQFHSYGQIPGGLWWLPIAMLIDIAIKERKTIVNAIGNTYLKYKDKKGVIAQMDFYFNNKKYSTRFSTEDFKWHCVDPKDAKINVKDDILKTSLESEYGKKFKKHCIDTWAKLFKPKAEGEEAPFKLIIDNASSIDIKSKELDKIKKIADNFDKITAEFKGTESTSESEITEAKFKMPTKEEIKDKILKMLKSMAFNKAIQAINKFTRNYFNDGIVRMYKEKVVSKMSDDELKETAKEIFEQHKSVGKTEDKEAKDKETDRREDNNTSTELDDKSVSFSCMFEGETGKKLKEIILKMNQDSMEATKKVEDKQKEVEQELKKAKADPNDVKAFGPAAAALLDAGKSPEEVKKALDSVHDEVKESCNECMRKLKMHTMFVESKTFNNNIESIKQNILSESILIVNRKYITESFLSDLFGKTVSIDDDKVSTYITWGKNNEGKHKKAADTLLNMLMQNKINGKNAEEVLNKVAQNGDLNASARTSWYSHVTGPAIEGVNIWASWAPLIAAAVIGITYKYKKEINALIDRGMARYRNSKGRIAEMNFKTTGAKTKYKTYFNIKDFVWRCQNLENINHQPSEALLKASLDSELGKKFREYCKTTWEPIFNSTENKKLAINFSEIIKEYDKFGLDKETVGYLKDFVENWKKIEEACLSDNYKFDIKMSDKKLK